MTETPGDGQYHRFDTFYQWRIRIPIIRGLPLSSGQTFKFQTGHALSTMTAWPKTAFSLWRTLFGKP
jgi:hypothetical protein